MQNLPVASLDRVKSPLIGWLCWTFTTNPATRVPPDMLSTALQYVRRLTTGQ